MIGKAFAAVLFGLSTGVELAVEQGQLGDWCRGYDSATGQYWPGCVDGLVCEQTADVCISGRCHQCVEAGGYADIWETCEGFNESTGKPFPKCAKGLKCIANPWGAITIPGSGNICIPKSWYWRQ